MKALSIIKASAGSGKTWTLTREYIKFLVPEDSEPFNPRAFRHILAVTFTNKATEEMKSRIIEELHKLSTDPSYEYPEKGKTATPLMRERAAQVLSAILHDYASFSVSTIDRFFQVVMRAFAREINQYASYKVELDQDSVLHQAVDHLLASLDEPGNESLLGWLTDYSLEKIREGGKWDISKYLYEFSQLFAKEDFRQLRRTFDDSHWSRERIAAFRAALLPMLEADEKHPDPFTKEEVLTAKLLDEQVPLLGIVADLYNHIDAILKEHNLVLLGDTADVLGRIIDGSDTPFIYEKVGTRYDHFMLDEFQDTSRLQWENFRPLLKESVSRNLGSLVVGDIKQSIYRWRGSDMNLLHSEVQAAFDPAQSEVHHKQENWRSDAQIIDFNNGFFGRIGELLGRSGERFAAEIAGDIAGYYSDVVQKPERPTAAGCGYVRAEFLRRADREAGIPAWDETVVERLPGLINELLTRYRPSDIAFLVRKNEQGARIAQMLLERNYPVVTEDSLTLSSCLSVRKLVALLKYRVDPTHSVNATLMETLFGELPQLPQSCRVADSLYAVCDALIREYLTDIPEGDHAFLFAFLDAVLSYTDRYGSNLAGFVEWWDEKGCREKISAAGREDAFTVMTIHKAKGLDFPVVIIPFFNEPFKATSRYLWCRPAAEPFSGIGLVALPAKTALEKTVFAEAFRQEMKTSYVDAINTVYVAMTRSVKEMYLFAPVSKMTKDGKKVDGRYFAVSDLLYAHLKPDTVAAGEPFFHEEGAPGHSDAKAPAAQSAPAAPLRLHNLPYDDRLRLSLKGEAFFSREEGIRYHDILSRIETEADLPDAVAEAVREGVLPAEGAREAEERIAALLAKVASRHWFDGTYRPLNEVSIVDETGAIHRPDRVLVERDKPLGQGCALVIDYKFGHRQERYARQIRRYMDLIQRMGYREVRGTLWYCNEEAEDIH